MSKLEYCDICNEPTGNAGVMDDSWQCEVCGRIICEDCVYLDAPMDMSCGDTPVWCVECGKKYEELATRMGW